MRTTQPKKNRVKLAKYDKLQGNELRLSHQHAILDKSPIFPKPLEYSDIDKAMFEFIDKSIELVIDGELVPTYTLYSNQRFSEYTQMWEHSDENGNLYLNFKTINREKAPGFGENQGKLWRIPGRRKYTLAQRSVLDDNGTESYEIYTMTQPYAVDLIYTINFISTTVDNVNKFNQKLNKLFSARQCYINPNGYHLPIVIDDIRDETSYSISDRKFYVQSATLKLMAYIIEPEDFEIKRFPKRTHISNFNNEKHKPHVEIEDIFQDGMNKRVNISIQFKPCNNKAEFVFDSEAVIEEINTKNVRNVRVMVNDTLYFIDKGFKLHDEDKVKIQIVQIDKTQESVVEFIGYDPTEAYSASEVNAGDIEDIVTDENISVE